MRKWEPAARAAVLAWYVLGAALRLGFRLTANVLARRREARASIVGRTLAELFQALGPCYVKLGQILSTRHDLLSESAIVHLERLQDRLPPGPFREVRDLFRDEQHVDPDEVLLELEPSPVGSGSIATVYRGRLRDGRRVAIKVRRPGIASRFRSDLRVLRIAGSLVGRLPPLRRVPVASIVEEFCTCLERQLDFPREAAANRRLRRALEFEHGIVVPLLVEELCSPSILTMELVGGVQHPRGLGSEAARAALRSVLRSLYRMIFVEGLIHCDMHQGNLRFLPDGRAALLDFGFMSEFSDRDRLNFAKFFYAMATNDGAVCARITLELAASVPRDLAYDAFEADVVALVDGVARVKASDFQVAGFVASLFGLQRRHRIRGTSEFVMAIVSLVVVEGIVKELYPDLDFQHEAKPFIFRASIRPFRSAPGHTPPEVPRPSSPTGAASGV